MFKKIIWVLAALLISGKLLAGNIQMIEEALELSMDRVTLPGTLGGSISVRKCAKCVPDYLPLNGATALLIGDSPASLADFRKASRDSRGIYIFYDIKTGVVTRMVLAMPHKRTGRKTR